jgi:light-regulated signal transduction histidine kinase (bacteriophytochrome)
MAQASTPAWAPDLNPNPNAEAQRKRDAILHKAFDLRRQHEAQVAGGVSEKSCYDYVRDSVNTFKQSVDKNDIQHFHDTITRCGKVQSFGCFLAVHPVTLCVVACNSNTEKFLGKPWHQVLGSPIESLFNEPNKVQQILKLQNIWVANPVLLSSGTEGKAFNAVVSLAAMRTKDQLTGEETDANGYLFEIEDTGTLAGDTQTEGLWQAHQLMRSAVARVQTCLSIEQIFSVAVEEIQKLSGLDRIMVYKFHPDMHGEVVEEYKQDYVKESLFGLHYPATDIPQIARELFKTNRVRHIMNIRDPGDDILCDSQTINPTDISLIKSVLRQPHACHLEYLQNMGSTASLTLAIVMDDKLWGLFACHHHGGPNQDNPQPLFVPYQKRAACEFLVQAICARIKSFIELAHHVRSEQRMNLHMGACERLTHFKSRDQFLKGLNGARGINLCDYIPHTTGAAVVLASSIHTSGSVPSDEMIRRILSIILPNNHMKKKEVLSPHTLVP